MTTIYRVWTSRRYDGPLRTGQDFDRLDAAWQFIADRTEPPNENRYYQLVEIDGDVHTRLEGATD